MFAKYFAKFPPIIVIKSTNIILTNNYSMVNNHFQYYFSHSIAVTICHIVVLLQESKRFASLIAALLLFAVFFVYCFTV